MLGPVPGDDRGLRDALLVPLVDDDDIEDLDVRDGDTGWG